MGVILPTIRTFSGQIPDKAVMDKDTFANSVHTYLNYFNNEFVPDTQDYSTKFEEARDEVENFVNSGEQIKSDVSALVDSAQNYKDLAQKYANADKDVEVETGYYSAKSFALHSQDYSNDALNYKNIAKDYANADENVVIEGQYYSAKHYMLKTQAIKDDAVAQLPEGTIDDSAVGTKTTWSSSKIDDEFKKRATAVIDGGSSNTAPDVYIDGGSAS